jgi:arylsulfatase
MPTLLTLADIAVPQSCDGIDMLGQTRRSTLYGDCLETPGASRMLHDGRMKLIWYPAGNVGPALRPRGRSPRAAHDLAMIRPCRDRRAMEERLAEHCYGHDLEQGWVRDGRLEGYDPGPYTRRVDRSFHGQRGLHYPEPPELSPEKIGGLSGMRDQRTSSGVSSMPMPGPAAGPAGRSRA